MARNKKLRSSAPSKSRDATRLASRGRRHVSRRESEWLDIDTRSESPNAVFRHHWILWVGPVVMLVAALFPWPYGYYNLLRFCVCGAAAFLAYQQWTHDDAASKWVVILVAIALLYNPLLPIHLTREIWTVLNIGTSLVFVGHLRSLRLLLSERADDTRPIGRKRSDR